MTRVKQNSAETQLIPLACLLLLNPPTPLHFQATLFSS